MNQRPSLYRVILTDYIAFLAVLLPAALWGVYAILQILQQESSPGSLYVAIALTLLSLTVVAWRYQTILAFFEDGVQALAIITEIWVYRGRGRIEYTYSCQGRKYTAGNDVQPNQLTGAFEVGEQVTILVDPNDHQRAIIRDLYV